jgi:hypothetical protein
MTMSKVIMMESGEVGFHDMVSTPVEGPIAEASFVAIEPLVQAALDHGVTQTINDLQDSFKVLTRG